MIAAILILFAQQAVEAPPRRLDSAAACALARAQRIRPGTVYSIPGRYFADGMHGSEIEVARCDAVLFPVIEGNAAARIADYHRAFREKCGADLMGNSISGRFTGKFVRRRSRLFGMRAPMRIDFFVVSDINSADLDPASIRCAK